MLHVHNLLIMCTFHNLLMMCTNKWLQVRAVYGIGAVGSPAVSDAAGGLHHLLEVP